MKKMNKVLSLAFAAIAMVGVSACVETAPEYVPGDPEPNNGSFFLPTNNATLVNPSEFTVGAADRSFTYWVGRTNASGAQEVKIANNSDPCFNVPSTVSFAAGEATAKLVVTFDMLPEENKVIDLEIDPSCQSLYGGVSHFRGALNCTPVYKLLAGSYKSGLLDDYFGRGGLNFDFNVVLDEEDENHERVIVENLDPYFAKNGFTAATGENIVEGFIDTENLKLLIPSYQPVGYGDCVFLSFDDPDPDVAEGYADYIEFDFDPTAKTLTLVNGWGITGWYVIYYGGEVCTKYK